MIYGIGGLSTVRKSGVKNGGSLSHRSLPVVEKCINGVQAVVAAK